MKTYFNFVKRQILGMPFVKYIPSWMNVTFAATMILLLELSVLTIICTTLTANIFSMLSSVLFATAVIAFISKCLLIVLFYIPMFIFKICSTAFIFLFPIFLISIVFKFMEKI